MSIRTFDAQNKNLLVSRFDSFMLGRENISNGAVKMQKLISCKGFGAGSRILAPELNIKWKDFIYFLLFEC